MKAQHSGVRVADLYLLAERPMAAYVTFSDPYGEIWSILKNPASPLVPYSLGAMYPKPL